MDHAQRRIELAEAARRVIGRAGLEGATVRAISEEAGFSTGVLTHYFADKNALVLAALQVTVARSRRKMAAYGSETGLAAIRRLMRTELIVDDEDRVDQRVWLAFYAQAPFSEVLAAEERALDHEWRGLIISFLAQAVEAGGLRTGLDLAFEADRILALVDGVSAMATFDPRYWSKRRQRDLLDRHLASLAPTRRGGQADRPSGRRTRNTVRPG